MTSNAIRSSTSLRRLIQPAALVALGLASTVALADAPICEPKAFVTTLATFAPYGQPVAAPLQASDGNLYGTTFDGGSTGNGMVYKLTTSGVWTILHSFAGPGDGSAPMTALIQGSDGALYGSTLGGAKSLTSTWGALFKITLDGTFTLLHAFKTDGSEGCDPSNLIQASDGNFYGTTAASDCSSAATGTVFKITPAGVLTILHRFSGSEQPFPGGGVVQAADGYLYGLTGGTFYRISLSGSFAVLAKTGGENLLIGPNGTFYALSLGSGYDWGSVFQITPTTTYVLDGLKVVKETTYPVTTLHSFSSPDAASSLTLASDGSLYGTTVNQLSGYGTIFRVIPGGGGYSLLFTFDSSDGADGQGIAQGSDGTFYGAAFGGEPGLIFSMYIACVPPLHTAAPAKPSRR
jgi:uncharacterized repeat protein (TIGR03803 family)